MRGVQGSEPVTLGAAFGYLTQASGSRRCGRACSGSGLQTPDLPHRTCRTAGIFPLRCASWLPDISAGGVALRLAQNELLAGVFGSGPAPAVQSGHGKLNLASHRQSRLPALRYAEQCTRSLLVAVIPVTSSRAPERRFLVTSCCVAQQQIAQSRDSDEEISRCRQRGVSKMYAGKNS